MFAALAVVTEVFVVSLAGSIMAVASASGPFGPKSAPVTSSDAITFKTAEAAVAYAAGLSSKYEEYIAKSVRKMDDGSTRISEVYRTGEGLLLS
tara:strand:- start:2026 stop:2307 length:282 start_codon:yes stop_codon:yes gene_type:complete